MTQNQAHRPEQEEVRGRFGRVLYRNEENGSTLALFVTEDGRTLKASGPFAAEDLTAREVTLWGRLMSGRRGPVFRVERGSIWRGPPVGAHAPSLEGVRRLCSEIFRGHQFGEVSATNLCEALGSQTWGVLTREPFVLAEHVGGIERARALQSVLLDVGIPTAAALARLMGIGLSYAYAERALDQLGTRGIEMLREDPYRLIGVRGIRFATADRIARDGFGVAPDDPRRLHALAVSVLEDAADQGHTSLPLSDVLKNLGKRVDVREIGINELDILENAVREGALVEDLNDVYLPRMLAAEERAADGIARLVLRPPRAIASDPRNDTALSGYTPEQREAVLRGLTDPIVFITGGPGTGKTTVTREIVRLALQEGVPVTMAATTNKAADRLTEAIVGDAPAVENGQLELTAENFQVDRAVTIQSLVGNSGRGRPLPPGIVVIDEMSMMDLPLLARILDNVGQATSLVFVGDPNQLAPVLAGNSARDLRNTAMVPTVELTKIHRQGSGSLISLNASRILRGELPIFVEGANPGAAEARLLKASQDGSFDPDKITKDSFFIDSGPIASSPTRLLKVVERVGQLGFDLIHQMQVYTPMHKGYMGTRNLNRMLQNEINPSGKPLRSAGQLRLPIKGARGLVALNLQPGDRILTRSSVAGFKKGVVTRIVRVEDAALVLEAGDDTVRVEGEALRSLSLEAELQIREGDPVLQTENDKIRQVANGMRGIVLRGSEGGGMVVAFQDREVEYTAAQARKLQLAYATTVHKGQGQEEPVSILVLHESEHMKMLERSLLYVAHTRAREMFVCVGTPQALAIAVREVRGQARKTRLADRIGDRLMHHMGEGEPTQDQDAGPFGLLPARTEALLAPEESVEDEPPLRTDSTRRH